MKHVVRKKAGKFRVVVKGTGRIAKNRNGKARDGGGHSTFTKAAVQAGVLSRVIKRK